MNFQELENDISEVVDRIGSSVVLISKDMNARTVYGYTAPAKGLGSGIILSSSGYIVTNFHVVEGATRIEVTTPQGNVYEAEYKGGDRATDIAILRIRTSGLEPAVLGDSDHLRVGQFALAIGNALGLPGKPTVSLGVISALERPLPQAEFVFEGLIQTDAAINPGNSGGPLATLDGKVIGINFSMIPFAQGIGFALPINTVKRIMNQVLEHGRVIRPWLGISGVSLHGDHKKDLGAESGVYVAAVTRDSPAHIAGILPGDVIESMEGTKITDMKALLAKLSELSAGSRVRIGILRNGRRAHTETIVEEMPDQYPTWNQGD
ncbi:MAG: trypsin-like peptidase domain-containing protein [Candidatus Thermoplasmatota archaeon]|nr:trypsin-like peptidase domain-containing protein [Candidatus Thermoplasmatota archaeon]MCL5794491.1 trypsin-like peptidase domain-containing protein [Candidatus Thermoplasmatota archaeon]